MFDIPNIEVFLGIGSFFKHKTNYLYIAFKYHNFKMKSINDRTILVFQIPNITFNDQLGLPTRLCSYI